MSVVHPLLLGGLLLIAVPILIHLIMQQKPKHLLFPALRFLQEKMRTTRRRLQLRHLLLLLLRIFLIVLMCLALARVKLFSERFNFSAESPVAVVLLFDTSASMEYSVNRKSRLEDAQVKARELLAELPEGSRVAIFDSSDLGGEWARSLADARDQVDRLQIRPGNAPVTRQIHQAFRLLESATRDDDPGAEPPPRLLFVFSDRTQGCWDDAEAKSLTRPATISAVFLDVGVDQPVDLALTHLELSREVLGAGDKLEVRVTVQATGADADTSVTCRFDGEMAGEQKPIKVKADSREVIRFERKTDDLDPGPHQVEVKLGTTDSLPFDDLRYATFEVRSGRKILVLADKTADARLWKLALEAKGVFRCDVKPTSSAGALDPKDLLAEYKAVCLLNVATPEVGTWSILEAYVQKGGKLAILPGSAANLDDYNLGARLVPGKLVRLVETPNLEPTVPWDWNLVGRPHPLLAPFLEWKQTADVQFFKPAYFPQATRYWQVQADSGVVVRYAGEGRHPALVERQVGQGRVLLFTTGFDGRKDANDRWFWNNYMASSFLLVLVNESMAYLVGDLERPSLNRACGEPVRVELPATPVFPFYTLQGPGIIGATATVTRAADQNVAVITQAALPGNYTLADGKNARVAGFSLNVKPDECQLGQVDPVLITGLLGADSVLPVDRTLNLRDAIQGQMKQPIELLPYLMMLLLLLLAFENLLANKFYRNQDQPAPGEAATPSPDRAFLGSMGQVLMGAGGGALLGLVIGFVVRGIQSGSWSLLGWTGYLALAGAIFWPLGSAKVGRWVGAVWGGAGGALLGAAFFAFPAEGGKPGVMTWLAALAGALAGVFFGLRAAARKK